jgi:hypothetical protein
MRVVKAITRQIALESRVAKIFPLLVDVLARLRRYTVRLAMMSRAQERDTILMAVLPQLPKQRVAADGKEGAKDRGINVNGILPTTTAT